MYDVHNIIHYLTFRCVACHLPIQMDRGNGVRRPSRMGNEEGQFLLRIRLEICLPARTERGERGHSIWTESDSRR